VRAVLGVGHHHVGRQAVAKVPTSRAVPQAEGWPVSENGLLPGVGDLAGQQVDVVDHVVDPGAARVLVEAHGPERHDLGLRVGVQLGQRLELVPGHAGELGLVEVYSETNFA
jgi:hypothetical protein